MPDYTPGGIQFPIESDKIKDGTSPSALADNFKTLALSADAHANDTAEAARVAATADSKAYADGKDTSNRSAWAQADAERLVEAKAYTDDRDEAYRVVDRALWREEDQAIKTAAISEAVATSKTYADERDAAYRTADRALWRSEDQTIKTEAATDATTKANAAKTDAIADATTKYGGLPARVTAVEAKNTAQDGRLDGVESKNVTQDSRIDSAESRNASQDGRLDHLEAVAPKVSNLALDTDGTPYFAAGSTQVHVIPDTDGNPYYLTFGSASRNAGGNIDISF